MSHTTRQKNTDRTNFPLTDQVRITRSMTTKTTANSAFSSWRSNTPSPSRIQETYKEQRSLDPIHPQQKKHNSAYKGENSSYSKDKVARRPRSAHAYGIDVTPYSKERKENTSHTPMEGVDHYSNQTRDQSHYMRTFQDKYQASTDRVLTYQAHHRTIKSSEDKKLDLKHPIKPYPVPVKASHSLRNFAQTDFDSTFSSDLNESRETIQSNEADQFDKLQYLKIDFKEERIFLSENWFFLLSRYYDNILHFLKIKLGENIVMDLNQNSVILRRCTQVELVKSLLRNDVIIIDHSSSQKSWLIEVVKEWKYLIDSLQNRFFCIIYCEDYSKTYVCTTVIDTELILSEITKFLNQGSIDIEISPHVMKFVKYNEKFSDLQLDRKSEAEIWIKNISKTRLAELKEEMNKVSCQSYLIDDNQYELLCGEKQELLSDIGKSFHVEGKPYQLNVVGDIPVVFQVDQLTNISCIVNTDPENIPVDSLISVNWKKPSSKSGLSIEIHKGTRWESPAKQYFHVQVEEYSTIDMWTQNFHETFTKAFSEEIPPVTIGISLPVISSYFEMICKSVFDVLQALCKKRMEPLQRYVILIVPDERMKFLAEKLLKNPSSLHKALPNYGIPTRSFAIKVIRGNLADQEVDVIVNSTNQDLNLKKGKISSSLLKKAGPNLQKYCSSNYPKGIMYPDFAVSPGYNLPCKYVFHGVLATHSADMVITGFVYNCLKYTASKELSSIAFPALGTGILKYPIFEVVQQMNKAFKIFEKRYPETTLREIRIVLYSDDMELDLFSQLDNSQKRLSETEMIPEQTGENPPKSMNWIQMVNYSCSVENLPLAISTLEEQLKQPSESPVKIPLEELEDVFFFKDLRSVIPNIVQQLDNKKEKFYHLHLSPETKEELDALILEVKGSIEQEKLDIIQPVSSTILDLCLLKTRQAFPQVKYIVTNNGQRVIFQSLNWNLVQEAKYFLEVWLGMKSANYVSENRFNISDSSTMIYGTGSVFPLSETQSAKSRLNKIYQEDLQPAAASVTSSTLEPVKNYASIQSSQNNPEDSCCFQTESGLLIKVYQGDILDVDVDGIVNAANKWLYHGGGVAKAIINAAGDSVNNEGRIKLQSRTLDDGQVLSTSAGNLKRYKNIIHAVGPVYSKNDEYCMKRIADAVSNSLQEAVKLNLYSIALPALSSAIFGVPMHICSKGYYAGVQMFNINHFNSCLKEVHFVDKNDSCIKEIQKYFSSCFISTKEESRSPNNEQSPKNISRPSSATKGESSSPIEEKADDLCLICRDSMKNPKILEKCKHAFCTDCITQCLNYKPKCPVCKTHYGIETGMHLPGTMNSNKMYISLPGYEMSDSFWIEYKMKSPSRKQKIRRSAYLPANKEGMVVLKMLQLAFERCLIFTVGESRTTSAQNAITWNDIHHKTSTTGGELEFGYPDPTYLQRVTQELADHGITPDDVTNRTIQQVLKIT